MNLTKAFSKSKTIEEIISPMRRITAELEAYEVEKLREAAAAEETAKSLMAKSTEDLAEARRAAALSNQYRLLVGDPAPTAVAAE